MIEPWLLVCAAAQMALAFGLAALHGEPEIAREPRRAYPPREATHALLVYGGTWLPIHLVGRQRDPEGAPVWAFYLPEGSGLCWASLDAPIIGIDEAPLCRPHYEQPTASAYVPEWAVPLP